MIGRVALLVTFKKVKPKPQSLSRSHIRDLATIMTKRILRIIAIVIINVILLYFSFLLHFSVADPIIRRTASPFGLVPILFLIIFIGGIVFMYRNRFFRLIGVGTIAITVSMLVSIIFLANQQFSSKGTFRSFEVIESSLNELNVEFTTAYKGLGQKTNAGIEFHIPADSIQIEVKEGFFGMDFLSENVSISENSKCETLNYSYSAQNGDLRQTIHHLLNGRCYSQLLDYYNTVDSLSYFDLYNRGLIHLYRKEYDLAASDLLSSQFLKYGKVSKENIDIITQDERLFVVANLFADAINANKNGLAENKEYLETAVIYQEYEIKINYCLQKLN